MPINRRVPLTELRDAMQHYLVQTRRRVTIQYVLLAGENDAPQDATQARRLSYVSMQSCKHAVM